MPSDGRLHSPPLSSPRGVQRPPSGENAFFSHLGGRWTSGEAWYKVSTPVEATVKIILEAALPIFITKLNDAAVVTIF